MYSKLLVDKKLLSKPKKITYSKKKYNKFIKVKLNVYELILLQLLCGILESRFFIVNKIQGLFKRFPDFFRMGTFIDSTHMKL